jgi:Na+-transporting NADH:ubiquinone oxidoreductase subunit NqrC
VIVVMLSLVLLVIVVSNVVLWSFQMNQFDLDRMHENVIVANVTRVKDSSSWFTAQREYTVNFGSRISGIYTDTQTIDNQSESFM